jgi:hypothetical protein
MLGDTLFFHTLQAYCADTNLRFKTAVTADFNAKVNEISGSNYDWYFTDWIYQPNHPVYQNKYNIVNHGDGTWDVNFQANQAQTNPAFFRMLLNFRVIFADMTDTSFRAMNDINNQVYTWTFSKEPILLQFDPNNEIVLKQASTILGITDPIKLETFHLYQNIPNPAANTTRIVYELIKDSRVHMDILDISGKVVFSPVNEYSASGKHSVDINCSVLSPGTYFYTLQAGDYKQTRKMIITR